MRTAMIKIYTVNELSREALEHAHSEYCQDSFYPWGKEEEDSLKAFIDIFPVRLNRRADGFIFTGSEEIGELKGIRLSTYIWNNYRDRIYKGKYYSTPGYYDKYGKYHYKHRYSKCQIERFFPLTGYYIDMEILQPIYAALDMTAEYKWYTFEYVLEQCFETWLSACEKSYEDYFSLQSFIDTSQANGWEYTEDGEIFTG